MAALLFAKRAIVPSKRKALEARIDSQLTLADANTHTL